jgi:hypothetical protein
MAIAEILPPALPGSPGPHGFQNGHPKYGGRKKSSPNRFGGDLREAVVAGIQAVGFMEKDKKGWKHGPGGVQGFIEWLALHEPKTAAVAGRRAPGTFASGPRSHLSRSNCGRGRHLRGSCAPETELPGLRDDRAGADGLPLERQSVIYAPPKT